MVEGLFATLTNVSFDDKAIAEITDRIHQEKPGFAQTVAAALPLRT